MHNWRVSTINAGSKHAFIPTFPIIYTCSYVFICVIDWLANRNQVRHMRWLRLSAWLVTCSAPMRPARACATKALFPPFTCMRRDETGEDLYRARRAWAGHSCRMQPIIWYILSFLHWQPSVSSPSLVGRTCHSASPTAHAPPSPLRTSLATRGVNGEFYIEVSFGYWVPNESIPDKKTWS